MLERPDLLAALAEAKPYPGEPRPRLRRLGRRLGADCCRRRAPSAGAALHCACAPTRAMRAAPLACPPSPTTLTRAHPAPAPTRQRTGT